VDDERSATLVVRVWLEDDDAFRARLTAFAADRDDGQSKELTVAVAASRGDVLSAVRAWLDAFPGTTASPVDTAR
jgi:broad specificity phosphatase PhoE